MKATGIVRRIDDLGRVVIPKEIRRTMRIREGDPLEIFTDKEGGVILKKYSPIGELNQFAGEFAESAYNILGSGALVTDTDQVVAVSGGSKKDYMEKKISPQVEKVIHDKKAYMVSGEENVSPLTSMKEEELNYTSQIIVPIVSHGDAIGSVIFFSRKSERELGESEMKAAEVGAHFLARQMEN
ncbi:MAG: stage V sporulation protein T [Anaerovoracaceae bacterium]|jgi:AbrB family transcriptional regulator (stage V sporulation protein T)